MQTATELRAGVHENVPFDVYKRWPAINASILEHAWRSPMHAKFEMDNPSESSDAMDFGTAVHLAVLEPDEYQRRVVESPKFDRRTKDGKAAAEEFERAAAGLVVVGHGELAAINRIRDAIRANDRARKLTATPGMREVSLLWQVGEQWCKARIDKLVRFTDGTYGVVDLKTTRNADPKAFPRDAIRLGYHRKAAWYVDAVGAVLGAPASAYIVAVESEPPHGVAVYEMSESAIAQGRNESNSAFTRLAAAFEHGRWDGYPDELHTIEGRGQ